MKVTFFGTTTLLFDDGADQVLFDAHFTRPSLARYIFGSASTDESSSFASFSPMTSIFDASSRRREIL